MQRTMGCFGSSVISLIFLAVGGGLLFYGVRLWQNARVSTNWPTVQGQVVSSSVRVDTDDEGTSYFADVLFTYVVNDHRYESDRVTFGQFGNGNRSRAQGIVDRYPVGGVVPVYYQPEKPETAVLEPGVTAGPYFILGMGVCFSMVPIFLLLSGLGRLARR